MGEERLMALLQESLAVATRTGAAKPADFRQVIVDTTVQEKAIALPTDAKLLHGARERLVRLAKAQGVRLRQSYARVSKRALIQYQRHAHAKQFRRAHKALRRIRTLLGRVMRDITRKIKGRSAPSRGTCRWPGASRTSASAVARCTRCMRLRWSASGRARRTGPMSSA